MSNLRGEVTLDWADGSYTFRLTVTGAIELESKCEAAIAVIASRIMSGAYSVNDVRETIRIGLIGGGQRPHDALRLVRTYVDERPLAESHQLARLIVAGLMFGFEAAPLGKPEAAASEATSPPPNGSTLHPSTLQHLSSDLADILTA